jgi:TfoX N-terminal domain
MAYTEKIAQRISEILTEKGVNFFEKKMFSGVCFMVDDKMCCGTHIDKKTGENFLLCRISPEVYEAVLGTADCIPMDFTGRVMKGYVFVLENGYKSKKDLSKWLQYCLDYNPIAKKSKK